jgi:hypothetical protein
MKQTSADAEEVKKRLAHPDEHQDNQSPETEIPATDILSEPFEEEPGITLHVHHFPDALIIIKEPGAQPGEQVIEGVAAEVPADASPGSGQEQKPGQEAAPALSEKKSARQAILTVSFYLFLILSGLLLQSSLPFNAPIATITIMPKSQQITYTGTSQLGRIIAPITLTQSQTVPTTGKGHQDARAATGTIVFYNGQAVQQTVPVGTVFTGAKGVKVATDQTITIPPGNPPTYGDAAVPAHALLMGSAGNIPAGAITTTIAIAVFAKNSAPFHGGQDERDYQTVTKHDINSMTSMLKPAVEQSMQAAFQTYRHQSEGLYILPCAPKVTSDHKPGQEATQVKVTASETCSAVAYNSQELRGKLAELLTHQAVQTLGTGYSLIGDVQVRITQATVTHAIPTLTFSCQGTWVYALSQEAQQQIKQRIAGKSRQEAIKLLLALPGIEKASIRWDEQTKLPESLHAIDLVIIVEA